MAQAAGPWQTAKGISSIAMVVRNLENCRNRILLYCETC
jgi:hypothetical protein